MGEPAAIKENAASLKKFYTFLHEVGEIEEKDLKEMNKTIKKKMPDWVATMDRYDDPEVTDMAEVWIYRNKMNMSENLQKMDAMLQKNRQKFAAVKKLELPIGQYAITGSGALGIRNLREIGDIDIIVTDDLWNVLASKYGVTDETGVKKIVFPNGIVEALGECSFYTEKKDPDAPTIADRITHAEIIESLPFESLEHVLYYKRKMSREKDIRDVLIIEEWQKSKRVNQDADE